MRGLAPTAPSALAIVLNGLALVPRPVSFPFVASTKTPMPSSTHAGLAVMSAERSQFGGTFTSLPTSGATSLVDASPPSGEMQLPFAQSSPEQPAATIATTNATEETTKARMNRPPESLEVDYTRWNNRCPSQSG